MIQGPGREREVTFIICFSTREMAQRDQRMGPSSLSQQQAEAHSKSPEQMLVVYYLPPYHRRFHYIATYQRGHPSHSHCHHHIHLCI